MEIIALINMAGRAHYSRLLIADHIHHLSDIKRSFITPGWMEWSLEQGAAGPQWEFDGGKSALWGGSITLDPTDALLVSDGRCAFNLSYVMKNIGRIKLKVNCP